MRNVSLFLFLLFFIFSCSSTNKAAKGIDQGNKEAYYDKGLKLLALPHEDLFFTFINTTVPDSPGEREKLLSEYSKNQEQLKTFFLDQGDVLKAIHYFNNLYAVKDVSEEEINTFYTHIETLAKEKDYKSFCKYLRLSKGRQTDENDFYTLLPVTEYNFLLAEISIKREYIDKNHELRKDHPYAYGSGIVLDSHHILTAYQLVEDLFLPDTRSYEISIEQKNKAFSGARVISCDSLLNLAVLETKTELQYIPDFYRLLGDSRTIKRGQPIFCLGHHAGYTSTLTKGIISAETRIAPDGGTWIQVDAAASPGAGGGMLIGEDGLLYGMILGGVIHEDINFAVPSNSILSILDQLIPGMEIKRPWLGILLAEKIDLPGKVYISGIFPSSPLTETGINIGDLLIALNDIPVDSVQNAKKVIHDLDAGNCVKVRYQNTTGEVVRYVYLKRRPDYPVYSAIKNTSRLDSLYLHFGFSVRLDYRKQIKQHIKNKTFTLTFYKVNAIKEDSYLEKMGVKPDDFIGILSDFYIHRTRYMEVLHIPADQDSHQFQYIEDYIYRMKREVYDENIL
ncbi:MAG: trypsin-like peptidase domain-containing protein [Spirochaetales bacterium]|nr:trypsin-like peptidase domain-containing protein [Spirochaetales bacterium]